MIDKKAEGIGKRIKSYRLKAGLTQVGLEDKSGVPSNTIARLEQGRHRASNQTIEKLAKALSITATDLLGY
jgi:transcriptional regulator with XRE-family HTH domain